MSINGVNNDVVVAENTQQQVQQTQTTQQEEKINSAFVSGDEADVNVDGNSIFTGTQTEDGDASIGLEVTESEPENKDKKPKKTSRPVTQFDVKNYLQNPAHLESNQYQSKLAEINKLNTKSYRTSAENIRLQKLQSDLRMLEQKVYFKLRESEYSTNNADVISNDEDGTHKLLTAQIINITDTKKVLDESVDDPNATKQETDNNYGIKITGMYSKEKENSTTTGGMDITLGNNYRFNGFLEHIKGASTMGISGNADIEGSDITAAASAYYTYSKGKTEFSAKGNYNIYSSYIQGEGRQNFQHGDISLNLNTPHFGIDAMANFTEIGRVYSANARGSYSKEWKNGVSFEGNANAEYEYYEEFKAHAGTFGLNAKVDYSDNNIQAYLGLDARGTYLYSKEHNENYFNASASLDCGVTSKNFDFHTNYTYERSADESELQYGMGLGYTFSKSGIGVNADYSGCVKLTGEEANTAVGTSPKHKINVSLKAPVGKYLESFIENKKTKTAEKANSPVL